MFEESKPIYVQIEIRGSLDQIWQLTQTPDLHERWDLRFSRIEYLPRPDSSLPQRFLYATRIGFGFNISGEGESVGARDGLGGECTSALKFWSADPKSLIRQGSGYWKYVPFSGIEGQQSVRFITGYSYDVHYGIAGRLFDRMVFRPLIGWATAWSFDRLRLWIEKGIDPTASMQRSAIHAASRIALAVVWIYQGVVPKLIFKHRDELELLERSGFARDSAGTACIALGWAEVALGLVLLLAWRSRWPLWFTVVSMPIAMLVVAITSPSLLSAAFNPVALNVSVFALAIIALLSGRDLPSARRCLRHPQQEEGA